MNGKFYKTVQDDIVDAVNYATSAPETQNVRGGIPLRPWGDAKQLAVLGGSFGVSSNCVLCEPYL